MTVGQRVPFCGVFDLSHAAVGRQKPQRTLLFASFQEGRPEMVKLGSEARLCEFVNFAADDAFSRKPEQSARAATGITAIAMVVGDEDRLRRWINNCPKQQFKLFQAAVQMQLTDLTLGDQSFLLLNSRDTQLKYRSSDRIWSFSISTACLVPQKNWPCGW